MSTSRGQPKHPELRIFSGPAQGAHRLFLGGVGNVDEDHERFASLLGGVQTRIFDVYAMTRGSIPATGLTPRSERSAHVFRSGQSEAGRQVRGDQADALRWRWARALALLPHTCIEHHCRERLREVS